MQHQPSDSAGYMRIDEIKQRLSRAKAEALEIRRRLDAGEDNLGLPAYGDLTAHARDDLTYLLDQLERTIVSKPPVSPWVNDENAKEPFDLVDERRRLVLAIEYLDAGDLRLAAGIIYDTEARLARESLRRKHEES